MHTKREIDKLLHKAIFKECVVSCVQLNEEDIHKYKLSLKKKKDNYRYEPAKKKLKLNTNRKEDTEEIPNETNYDESTESSNSSANVVINNNQVIDSRKTKSSSTNDVLKKNEFVKPSITMSASKSKNEIASTSTEEEPIEIDDEESTELLNSSANYVFKKNQVINPRKTMSASKSKNEIASTSTEEEPIEIDDEESTESSNSSANHVFKKNQVIDSRKTKSLTNDVLKKNEFVKPSITMSPSKPKYEIASTSTEEEPIEIDDKESTESSNYSDNHVFKKNQVIDSRKTKSLTNDVLKKNEFVKPRITMSASKPKNEIASTSTEEEPIEIDDEESTELSNSSANYVFKKNQVINPRKTMSSSKSKNEIASTSTEEVPIEIDDEESTESSNSSANYVFKKNHVINPRKTMSSSKSKNEIASTSTEEEPIEINDEESTESSNYSAYHVLKKNQVIDPRKTMCPSKSENEIASTSSEKVSIKNDREKSTQSSNSSNVLTKIWIIDPREMMDDDKYLRFINMFFDKKPLSTNVKTVESALNENFNLIEIEKLYNKYYTKFVQDTIAVIANLYIIYATTYLQYIARIKKSFENKSEAEKLKESYNAKLLHERYTEILERKVKINLTNVVSLFFESEFEKAFKMFFLSILTVVKVLKQPKSWKGQMFKNFTQFLLNSLKNYEYSDPRIFSMLQSNDFRLDCIKMMMEIEDSKDNATGVTDRLNLFFVTSVNSQKYFQKTVDAIVSESEVDLEILIDEASYQCCINSIFKDPIHPSTVQESNDELPVTNTIQSPINSDEQIKHSVLAESPDETFQAIPGLNRNKFQTIGNTAVESSTVTNQPLMKLSHELSHTQEVRSETYTPKVIPVKKYYVVTPNYFINPSVHVTTSSSATQPTRVIRLIQNNNTVANRTGDEGPNIAVRDQQVGPSIQLTKPRIIAGTNNLFVKLPIIKCFVNTCNRNVTITCSNCQVVKYCSRTCQQRHWYSKHINDCDRLLKRRTQR